MAEKGRIQDIEKNRDIFEYEMTQVILELKGRYAVLPEDENLKAKVDETKPLKLDIEMLEAPEMVKPEIAVEEVSIPSLDFSVGAAEADEVHIPETVEWSVPSELAALEFEPAQLSIPEVSDISQVFSDISANTEISSEPVVIPEVTGFTVADLSGIPDFIPDSETAEKAASLSEQSGALSEVLSSINDQIKVEYTAASDFKTVFGSLNDEMIKMIRNMGEFSFEAEEPTFEKKVSSEVRTNEMLKFLKEMGKFEIEVSQSDLGFEIPSDDAVYDFSRLGKEEGNKSISITMAENNIPEIADYREILNRFTL